jgi:hypothetical protein
MLKSAGHVCACQRNALNPAPRLGQVSPCHWAICSKSQSPVQQLQGIFALQWLTDGAKDAVSLAAVWRQSKSWFHQWPMRPVQSGGNSSWKRFGGVGVVLVKRNRQP